LAMWKRTPFLHPQHMGGTAL